jgi:hypothetical protein
MAGPVEQIIGIIRTIVASGRTRLLVAIASNGGLVAGIYFDSANGVTYCIGIIIVASVFIIAKTIQDITAGNDGK